MIYLYIGIVWLISLAIVFGMGHQRAIAEIAERKPRIKKLLHEVIVNRERDCTPRPRGLAENEFLQKFQEELDRIERGENGN